MSTWEFYYYHYYCTLNSSPPLTPQPTLIFSETLSSNQQHAVVHWKSSLSWRCSCFTLLQLRTNTALRSPSWNLIHSLHHLNSTSLISCVWTSYLVWYFSRRLQPWLSWSLTHSPQLSSSPYFLLYYSVFLSWWQYNPIKTIKTSTMGTLNMLGLAKRVQVNSNLVWSDCFPLLPSVLSSISFLFCSLLFFSSFLSKITFFSPPSHHHSLLPSDCTHQARMLLTSTSEVYGDPEVHPQKESYWGHVNPIGKYVRAVQSVCSKTV